MRVLLHSVFLLLSSLHVIYALSILEPTPSLTTLEAYGQLKARQEDNNTPDPSSTSSQEQGHNSEKNIGGEPTASEDNGDGADGNQEDEQGSSKDAASEDEESASDNGGQDTTQSSDEASATGDADSATAELDQVLSSTGSVARVYRVVINM